MVGVIAFCSVPRLFPLRASFPLNGAFPAGLKGEGHLALLYGVYAISVLLVTPVFGYLGDRIGGRSTMMCGAALALCAVSLLGMAPNLSLLLLGKFCQGAASAALWTSGLALIARTTSKSGWNAGVCIHWRNIRFSDRADRRRIALSSRRL
jgi:MFS family permease